MASKPFKVLIVGASVAGLSLALMLEKNGIEFVVLEAYPDIAPQIGASIGLLPNGLRILDQLGCYDAVMEKAEFPVTETVFRDSRGRPFASIKDFGSVLTERHGYAMLFLDRQMLIQILYSAIQGKSKVFTSERVVTIRNKDSSVTVTTKSGKTYTGDIIIGADGIHSTVRKQMWLEANRVDPKWIDPSEENSLAATYACIFGISEGIPGIKKGSVNSVLNEHFSYIVPSGPGDKTYWFLVKNLGKTVYGTDIPRFTKEEEENLAQQHWNDYVTPTLRFSDLYKHKTNSVYTSLPEYVYKRWYFQRIMTIGDASHKFEPVTGQGGNSAIETAAALTNHLVSGLGECTSASLTTKEVESIFQKVQVQREARTQSILKDAHARQRFECLETWSLRVFARYVFPYIPKQMLWDSLYNIFCPAVSLRMLPQPKRQRSEPYFDELFRTPSSRGWIGYSVYVLYVIVATRAYRLLFVAGIKNGTWNLLHDAMRKDIFTMDIPVRRSYTQNERIDRMLQSLVTVFFAAFTSSSDEQVLQLAYFLSAILPLVAIFTVEGFRNRNKWSLLSVPSIWGLLYQLHGIGFIAPIYFLASAFSSRHAVYFSPTSRRLSTSDAAVILPAVIVGYIVPTLLSFFPIREAYSRQLIIAIWQPAPIFVVILTHIFSRLSKIAACLQNSEKCIPQNINGDIRHLDLIYQVTGIISACFHIALVLGCVVSGNNISLVQMLLPRSSFAPVANLADGLFIFFQNDYLMAAAAIFLWCWLSIWDLYRVGLSNVSWKRGLVALVAGFALIGPGATFATVWYWREHIMTGENFARRI
ncbi:hypothetical protein BGW36DRAFT_411451 [Talaromyces proteolyticus]|uniref:FAD-binding domain-containing protein n=1 Tax=Talaromyces proteolyticus TaxID=1131652 RepID=A0AAD4KHP5_9EURO|nr:uncharacterized protein BGW36DRAFT_411451 [Talaromyces proteolyticus]KAH8690634.1 hypothetical protein BGW36DRAFT_411451 [Talaromyces proteolyticus]